MIFGEALFDVFPDGQSVLGGAPFNVAWNLKGLGLDPLFISRVGSDGRGEKVLSSMREWGMSVEGVQVDAERPTGVVEVSLNEGQPSFDIRPDQAYDFIAPGEALRVAREEGCGILYHGTLITRSGESRKTLETLRRSINSDIFVDVNLRPPWWSHETVRQALAGADWAKLNSDELFDILNNAEVEKADSEAAAERFRREFGLKGVVLTMGSEGAAMATADGFVRHKPVNVENLVDTVGAGDAFSAVTIMGLSLGWPVDTILKRAISFASEICGVRGATSSDHELYTKYARNWGL